MHLNESTTLATERIVLRPYRRWHVPQYHAWMQSEELREATASEPLSMDEEYEMQQSWRVDEDKLTFIVHSRRSDAPDPREDSKAFLEAHGDASTMLGDVNLFLHEPESDTDEEDGVAEAAAEGQGADVTAKKPRTRRAEMEIMFPPSPSFPSRSGLATHTLQVFLSYAASALQIPPSSFFARIGFDNEKSLGLFRKLGFVEGKRVEVFREVELVWPNEEATTWPWEQEAGWRYEVIADPRDEECD
ncbi:hypothetical protein JCM10908_001569 [Rhodotorula pacifica]|uniref:GNAT family N-acetyltransferase n=1 Tax=Rhodotorula pacifica TaxID=1495444 RepID=UPI0031797301